MTVFCRQYRSLNDQMVHKEGVGIMKTVTSGKTYLFLFLVILFVMQNRLQQWFEPFQYLDEGFAALFFPALALWIFKKKNKIIWTGKRILFLTLLLIFWGWGWGGNFMYHYQTFASAAKDSYVNLKFFLSVGAAFLMFVDDDLNLQEIRKLLWMILNGITVVLFVLCLLDLCFGIFSTETRGGMRAVKLFYSAYTFLVGQCVFLSAWYLWFYEDKKKRIIPPLAMLVFVMLSTRRAKAMGATACILMVYLLVFRQRQEISKKVKIFAGSVVCLAAVGGLYQLISYYFVMGVGSARAVLTIAAPFLAKDHFPFGTGWGTFGSAFSTEPYSPVYGMYQMAGVWGLSPDYHDFVADTFWPMIMGQCGFVGFAAFIGVLVLFVQKVWTLKSDKSAFAAALIPLLYLLVSSTSESAFANPVSVPFAFLIGFLFAEQKAKKMKQGTVQ